jgi:hypothetical protein
MGWLHACKSTTTIQTVEEDKSTPSQSLLVTGIVKKQGVTTYQYGTHVLNDKDGKIVYALKSEHIKLDDYIDKKVEIWGIPEEGYPIEGGPEFLEVIKIVIE